MEFIINLISEMTLEEKIDLIHGDGLFRNKGVDRLNIPSFKMADGPMGVRAEFENAHWVNIGNSDDFVTYLPCGSAISSTWNTTLAHKFGQVLGAETRGRGKDMILAPSMNIIRSPLCGRNFEYLSEDTHLTGEIAKNIINGIQENDVASCIKHFACNNQETERLDINTVVDLDTLHNIYLKAFYKCVEETDVLGVMGAYNFLNGEQCCESPYLLNEVLRNQWGYENLVVTDWGALKTTVGAVNAELDLEMSVHNNFDDYYFANPLKKLIANGEIAEETIDKKVKHILTVMYKLKIIGDEKNSRKSGTYNTISHRAVAKEIADQSIILLKNENILPLKKENIKKLLVIGENAEKLHSFGGGSAEIKSLYEISPLMGIKANLGGNCEVTFVKGYTDDKKSDDTGTNWQETSLEKQDNNKVDHLFSTLRQDLFNEALDLAKNFENIIFVGGLDHNLDVEGLDKPYYELPYNQEKLINALLDINPNTIINIVSGSAVNMTSFSHRAKALLWSYYNGMEGGNAFYDVVFGNVNPSGRLNQTLAKDINDYASHSIGDFGLTDEVVYREKDLVGYKHFVKNNVKSVFDFGYGLTYSQFEYSNIDISMVLNKFIVALDVKNTSSYSGYDVVQIYSDYNGVRSLVAFKKVFVKENSSENIVINVDFKELQLYSVEDKCYKTFIGEYDILVGKNVKEIVYNKKFDVK